MIVWGGGSITGGRYNPSTDSWVPTAFDPSIFPQDGQGAVWTGTEMIVWGGYTPTGGRYNPSTNTWGDVSFVNAPEGGPGAAHPLVVWTGTLMLVLTPFSTTAGGRYDPVSNVWTTMSSSGAPELDRGGATAVWTGSEMILWGGQGGIDVDLNTGGRYNPSTDSWTILSTLNAPRGRFGHVAVWTGSRMVVWGGGVQFIGLDLNSGGRYDPASDSWTPTSQSSAPAARRFHQTVWTGNSMIVWGGDDGFIYPDTGGRYDPALDSWTPTSTTGPPAGRTGFTAVWTGNAMIVWGGGSFRNDGAQYDPVADLWSPTSLAGAPSGRALHTAVWTGTKMIIWGGNSGTALNTGAIYDPLANSWSPTSLSGAPSIRNSHVAVWTEDHMVVWGGFNGSTALNTGGRYDSATDQWTPTSTLNAPSGGSTQKAVWTGSLMLVWGDGKSRYDPLLDQWTAYSPAPSQVQSRGHSAIWTGSRMIIWGGGGVPGPSGVPLYDTGGIYDPAGDTWTLTSTQNAASSRRYHTAVWTGAFMIVWGGTGPGEYSPHLNTGGRFIFGLSTDDDGDTFTECSGDCNDSSAAIHPGATEVCNGIDDNCSLVTDEDGSALCDDTNACTADTCTGATGCAHPIRDVDTDGHPDGACGGSDCNDLNPAEWSPPVEVSGLTLTTPSPADPSWASQAEAAGPGTSYDLVSGTLGPSAGVSFPTASCLQSAMATAYSDSRPGPSSGIAYWYLARARNSCATATYGSPNRDSGIPSCP
jgi:N-acetylneuraminic acid mutarotase